MIRTIFLVVVISLLTVSLSYTSQKVKQNEKSDYALTFEGYSVVSSDWSTIATIGMTEDGKKFRGPLVTYSKDGKECDLTEFTKVVRGVSRYLEASYDLTMNDLVYCTSSEGLCQAVDEIERRDAAIRTFRNQLDKCGWMAEPGAFDR